MVNFKSPSAGGGGKYENIKDGLYKGKFVRFEEGPTFYDTKETTDAYPQGKPQPKIRWVWSLFTADGTPLNEEISELTSDATGDRSTAARFFSAHLGRTFDVKADDVEKVQAEIVDAMVLLSVSTKPSGYRKVDVFMSNN